MGPRAGNAGHREVPRLADRHAHGARGVDPVGLVDLARSLVDIDSTTGREGDAGRFLSAYLRQIGYTVTEQPVDTSRFNVIATAGANERPPSIVFSTHVDCVPPFFPSRVEG